MIFLLKKIILFERLGRKMENSNVRSKQLFLFFLLIFSQNITWRLISLISDIEETMGKPLPFYQVLCLAVYIVFAIATTSDRESYLEFIENHPHIHKYFGYFMLFLFKIVSGAISLMLSLPILISANKDDIRQIAIETKKNGEDMKNYFNSSIYEVRLVAALCCIFIILVVCSFFLDEVYISYIADVCSMLSAIIGGMFVAKNIKRYNQESKSN